MYTDERNERNYFFRNLIVKILLILLFIFLLMWLFPMPNFNPFYDNLFTENMNNMTDTAKGYFTTTRLPKKEGESKTLTLKEMLDNKMIVEFTDNDGKTCDLNKSYVEVTKKDGEYVFKTNLSCSNKEDYVIEYFGCYDVCSDGTCKEETKPATVTEDVTEYRFYKTDSKKLIDKYVCKDGYTLEGTKCVLKENVEDMTASTLKCLTGYNYNNNTNMCEKENIELINATKTCKDGYIYATSMDKCIKLDTNVVDADISYTCDAGKLEGTKCNIETESSINADKKYSCEEGTLEGTKCIISKDASISYTCEEGTLEGTKCITSENADVSYKCATGTLSGTKCIITSTSTTPTTCSYIPVCSQVQTPYYVNTSSTVNGTTRYLYQTVGGYYVSEVCTNKQVCSGGKTVTNTSNINATPIYSCKEGTLSGTKCIINKDADISYTCDEGTLEGTKCIINKNADISYKCNDGTLSGTKCILRGNTQIDADKKYNCKKGTLENIKCILNNVLKENYSYECEIGTLEGTKCAIKTTNSKNPTYVCKKGYTLAGTNCYKTTTKTDIYNAEAVYKTVSTKVYKWSTSKTLDGWTKTGETRTSKVSVTSKY